MDELGSYEELAHIETKRDALDGLIRTIHSMQKLSFCLKQVANLSRPSGKIPDSIIVLYHKLKTGIINMTVPAITERLAKLDELLNKNILSVEIFLNATSISQEKPDDDDLQSVHVEITEFKRRVQTSIALRVLLDEKGAKVAPLKLAVPVVLIEQQLMQLDDNEKVCRDNANKEMAILLKDLNIVYNNHSTPEEVKDKLVSVINNIETNIDLLKQGKGIEDFVTIYEIIEFNDEPQYAEPLPIKDEVKESDDPVIAPAVNAVKKSTAEPDAHEDDKPIRLPLSFSKHLLLWIKAPWSISWNETEKYWNQLK